jgi:uncharacterized protein (TIGR02217 family)
MAFLEAPRFPENVSFGFSGGPGYLTEVIEVNSGDESRNQVWSQSRHTYEAAHAAREPAQWQPLKAFFHIAKGRANGFRLKDWTDFECPDAAGTGVMGQGVGTGTALYQLGKKYTAGTSNTIRNIVKPRQASSSYAGVNLYRNGILLSYGIAPGQVAFDESTGLVTFVADSTKNITGITKANPAVVTAAAHGFTNGKVIYITGVSGMTQVNNLAFTVAGATTNTFELSGIDSTNYGTYVNLGTASLYPQPADLLTWTGEFDVPCRFDTDQMKGDVIDKHPNGSLIVGWQSIPIVEIRFP